MEIETKRQSWSPSFFLPNYSVPSTRIKRLCITIIWSVFCYKLTTMVRVYHKLMRINEVYILNLEQIYAEKGQLTTDPSTANNFTSPNIAAWKTRTSHTEGLKITAKPQDGDLFTASTHSKKHQHRKSPCPPLTRSRSQKPGSARLFIWSHRDCKEGKSGQVRFLEPSQPGWSGSYEEAPKVMFPDVKLSVKLSFFGHRSLTRNSTQLQW